MVPLVHQTAPGSHNGTFAWHIIALTVSDVSAVIALGQGLEGSLLLQMQHLSLGTMSTVQADALTKEDLAPVNSYNPGLSGAWMLQRAMSVRPGARTDPNFINQVSPELAKAVLPGHSLSYIPPGIAFESWQDDIV